MLQNANGNIFYVKFIQLSHIGRHDLKPIEYRIAIKNENIIENISIYVNLNIVYRFIKFFLFYQN